MHLLFVCTGNICRSPTAERLTTAYANRLGLANLTASSAGTAAVIDSQIHPSAAVILEKLGGDAANFAARQITSRIAAGADLILTMTSEHRDAVLEHSPQQLRKTFILPQAARLISDLGAQNIEDLAKLRPQLSADEIPDVPDPIGRDEEYFSAVGSSIAGFLAPVLEICRRSM